MQVYDRAVKTMSETVNRLHDDGIKPTIVIGHQANTRILQKIREQIDTGDAVFVDCGSSSGTRRRRRYHWRWARVSLRNPFRRRAE